MPCKNAGSKVRTHLARGAAGLSRAIAACPAAVRTIWRGRTLHLYASRMWNSGCMQLRGLCIAAWRFPPPPFFDVYSLFQQEPIFAHSAASSAAGRWLTAQVAPQPWQWGGGGGRSPPRSPRGFRDPNWSSCFELMLCKQTLVWKTIAIVKTSFFEDPIVSEIQIYCKNICTFLEIVQIYSCLELFPTKRPHNIEPIY